MYNVQGKTAVITGAAGGMGLGMARSFGAAGMKLVIADIDAERLAVAVQELKDAGYAALGVPTNVADESQIQTLAQAALDEFGAVHVMSSNAGIGIPGTVETMSLDEWKWTLDVDLWSVIYGIRTFLPLMKEQGEGHITATSSMAGLTCGPVLGAYHVAKHGVVALMDTTRIELKLAKSAVRASVLCPGPVDTDIAYSNRLRPDDFAEPDHNRLEEKFEQSLRDELAGGMAPNEVGDLVLEAVQNERFWILTHPNEFMPFIEHRVAAIKRDHEHRM